MKIKLLGINNNRMLSVKALRAYFPSMSFMKLVDIVDNLPQEVEIETDDGDLSILEKQFDIYIVDEKDYYEAPNMGGCVFNPKWFAQLTYPDGLLDIHGDAKDLADAIYKLINEGIEREKIHINTPHWIGMA